MKFGFDLFKISYIPSPDLEFMEKEIGSLMTIWKMKEEWDQYIRNIGPIPFK